MARLILSANPGSISRKYALYNGDELLLSMHFEVDGRSNIVNLSTPKNSETLNLSSKEFSQPLVYFLIWASANDIIENDSSIDAAGLRFVAPGTDFQKNHTLNQEFVDKLASRQISAPLHISATLREAKEIMEHLPHAQLSAISDSAFHSIMPVASRTYALPRDDIKNYDLYRFGYHGISMSSVLRQLDTLAGQIHQNIVVCHLGGGTSVTAIKNGQSFDTSMGYSPLEGLPMVSRAGDIGIDAAFELMNQKNMSQAQLQNYLSTKSGLAGMSGTDGDIRKLLVLYEQSHQSAIDALNHYAYSIRKCIGSYVAGLGGIDMLVFTGTAGQRSAKLRELICQNTDVLGLQLDASKNNSLKGAGFINQDETTGIVVIETDELREIAAQTQTMING